MVFDSFTVTRHVSAPNIERGIDDMLLGRAPWTAAALYKKSSIANMRWDIECQKAQEWLWAWTVCLGGLRFVSLETESSSRTSPERRVPLYEGSGS